MKEDKKMKPVKVNPNEKTFRMDGKMVLVLIICAFILSILIGTLNDWIGKQHFFETEIATEPVSTDIITDDEIEESNENEETEE